MSKTSTNPRTGKPRKSIKSNARQNALIANLTKVGLLDASQMTAKTTALMDSANAAVQDAEMTVASLRAQLKTARVQLKDAKRTAKDMRALCDVAQGSVATLNAAARAGAVV